MAKTHSKPGFQVGEYLEPRAEDWVFEDRGAACEHARQRSLQESTTVIAVYSVGPNMQAQLVGIWINGVPFARAA